MSIQVLLGRDRQSIAAERWLPLALAIPLALFASYALLQLFWQVIDPPSFETSLPVSQIGTVARPTENVNLAPLAQFQLFGSADTGAVNGLPSAPNAPVTQLKLVLIGVAAGRDPKGGVAIIADENNHQDQYQAGAIVGGATLDSIYRDRVVLMYQGRLETLLLPRIIDAKTMGSGQALDAVAPAGKANSGPDVTALMIPSLAATDYSNGYVNPAAGGSSAAFAAVREQVLANPMQLADKIQPVIDANGNLSGIKLSINDPVLTRAGLRPDDLIVSVNGQRIDSFQKGQQIAADLASANEITVIVRREGREITLPAVRFR